MSSTIQIKGLQISVSKRSERSKINLKNNSERGKGNKTDLSYNSKRKRNVAS